MEILPVNDCTEYKGDSKSNNPREKIYKKRYRKMFKDRFEVDAKKLSPLVLDIRQRLDDYVIGQHKAKDEIVDALAKNLMVDPTRKTPIATLLFVGPTGVGKTEIVRALYRILFGNDLIDIGTNKLDCTNFSASHTISNAIGASPEFVGREQTPLLADKLIFAAFNKARKKGLYMKF